MRKLEIFGSVAYFLAKILILAQFQVAGWSIFLFGTPFWVILLLKKRSFIFAATETIGGIILLLNLLRSIGFAQEQGYEYAALFAAFFTFLLAAFYTGKNLNTSQGFLEVIIATAFSSGTCLFLLHQDSVGWISYGIMHLAAALLLKRKALSTMEALQWISLGIAVAGVVQSF